MKKVFLSFCTTIIMLCSCTSDYGLDVLGLEDFSMSPEKSIASFLSDNSITFSKNGLSLICTEEYRGSKRLSADVLLNNEYDCYPIYSSNMNSMKLVPLSHFMTDTVSLHYKYEYLLSYVDSLLNNSNKLEFKELTWEYNDKRIKTIAIFDLLTGEILYDNIMYNLFSQKSLNSKVVKKLTRSENPNEASNVEQVIFNIGSHYATYTVSWRITGEYQNWVITDADGNKHTYRVFAPLMPEISETLSVPADFPSRDDVVGNCYINSSVDNHYRAYYFVTIGIGYNPIGLPTIPYNYGTYNYDCVNGFGYAYKQLF